MGLLLFAETVEDAVNNHPVTPYLFAVFLMLLAPIGIWRGILGVKNRRMTVKWGKVVTGQTAVITGYGMTVIGAIFGLWGAGMLIYLLVKSDPGGPGQSPASDAGEYNAQDGPDPGGSSEPHHNPRKTTPEAPQPPPKPKVELKGDINRIAISSNGRFGVIATVRGEVIVFDPATMDPRGNIQLGLRNPAKDVSPLGGLAVSSDGSRVAIANFTDNRTELWDVNGGNVVAMLDGTKPAKTLVFSPSGDALAATYDGILVLVNARTGQEEHRLSDDYRVGLLSWTPDGSTVVFKAQQKLAAIRRADGQLTFDTRIDQRDAKGIAISPDGQWAYTASPTNILKWDTATGASEEIAGKLPRELYHYNEAKLGVSRDGMTLVAFQPVELIRLSLQTGEEMGKIDTRRTTGRALSTAGEHALWFNNANKKYGGIKLNGDIKW